MQPEHVFHKATVNGSIFKRKTVVKKPVAKVVKKDPYKSDIDLIRMNRQHVAWIESHETETNISAGKCTNCVYRDSDIGHCWYTMATNKQNFVENNMCKHFVDKEQAVEIINKRK